MKQSKFSFAAVFSLMILLGYAYFAFMGLVYWKEGDIILPSILTAAFIAVVLLCLTIMCKSRATRWKRIGGIGQIVFGTIIFAAFIVSAVPFTNFLDVLAQQKKFSSEIDNVLESAQQLDADYQEYVDQRLENYEEALRLVSRGKEMNPSEYESLLGNAAGSTDDAKIRNLSKSLKRKLVPDSIAEVQEERQYWVGTANHMSVWNIMLPRNIAKINERVEGWSVNYTKLSDFSYAGEDTEPFVFEEFDSDLSTLTSRYTKLHLPSALAIIVSLLCFAIMLLPYFMTERDVAGRTSKGKNVYE